MSQKFVKNTIILDDLVNYLQSNFILFFMEILYMIVYYILVRLSWNFAIKI